MPYGFWLFFLCLSTAPVVFLCTCSRNFIYECIRSKDFSHNENRKFQYILSNPIGETLQRQEGIFHNKVL